MFTKNFDGKELHVVDIETRSFVNLKHKPSPPTKGYATHKTTEVLSMAVKTIGKKTMHELNFYSYNNGLMTTKEKEKFQKTLKIVQKLTGIFIAHNYKFELHIIEDKLVKKKILPKQYANPDNWLCTQALAYRLSLHGRTNLQAVSEFFGVQGKLEPGHDLIQKFSVPKKDRKTKKALFQRND